MFKVFFYYIIVRKSHKTAKSKVFTKWDQDDEMYIMRCMSEPEAQRYLKKVLNKNLILIEDYVVGIYDIPFKIKPSRPAPWLELKQNKKGEMIAKYIDV